MKTISHTLGPWKAIQADAHGDDPTRWAIVVDRLGTQEFVIASVENGAPGDDLDTESANAHLIAAAPDLLAALKRAHNVIHTWHDLIGSADTAAEAWSLYQNSPEMQAINAAIQKAEG